MTRDSHIAAVAAFYDSHPISERQILDKLAADGVDPAGLSEDVLQHYDQDHYGGVEAVATLARLAAIDAGTRVLDVCSGMGGPARYLAHNFGCRVIGLDLSESRVRGARRLARMVGLARLVEFRAGNALASGLPDGAFDVVIGQEAWAHIPDKRRLIGECARLVRVGGRIAFTDILAGPALAAEVRERLRREMTFADLETMDGYLRLLEGAGCEVLHAEDLGATWTRILVDRLAMYRSLREQTVARFGAAHFARWDAAYDFFVARFGSGELTGGRLVARRLA